MSIDYSQMMAVQAELLGIQIADEFKPGVARYLQLAHQISELVMQHALEAVDEPAYQFSPRAIRKDGA